MPEVDPIALLLTALLNPVVIAVAIVMGAQADQWQKLIVAGFAAALAGAVAVWLATYVGLLGARDYGSDAGLFVVGFIYGTGLAAAARSLRRSA